MAHKQDIDPILAQAFFNFLFPIAFPNIDLNSSTYKFILNDIVTKHKLISPGALLEVAISIKKGLERHDTEGRDFVDGSDAKCASARWHRKGQSYGAPITNVHTKEGLLRAVIYERQFDKMYFFLIPQEAYSHISKTSNIDIPFNLNGTPHRNSKVQNINWWEFEVPDFSGILADVAPKFINYRKIRLEKKLELTLQRKKKIDTLILKNQAKMLTKISQGQCLTV